MHPRCYEDSGELLDNDQVLCPKRQNCSALLLLDGYETTVQAPWPSVVSLVSCTLSVFGSLLIVYTYARWKDLRTGSRSIVTFLALADLFTAAGYIFGSANYIDHYGEEENTARCRQFNTLCQIQSFVTTTSSMSSFAWTSFLAIYLYLVIVRSNLRLANKLMPLFHVVAWLFPLFITLPLLITGKLGYSPYAASNWCFIKDYLPRDNIRYLCGRLNYEVILLVLVGGKGSEIATYVLVIVLYAAIKWHLHKQTREAGSYQLIGESIMQRADKKLTFIPVVFILLRMWGTLQFLYATGVYRLMYFGCVPKHYGIAYTVLAYLQAMGDGGQGWGNVLLYVISSPKIRQRLLYSQNCCDKPGVSGTTSPLDEGRLLEGLNRGGKCSAEAEAPINDTTVASSWTPTLGNSLVDS